MLMLMAKSAMIDGYPIKDATHIALETTRQFLEQDDSVRRLCFPNRTDLHTGLDPRQITRVIYVVFSKRDEDVYREIIPQYFPPDPEHGNGSV